MRRPKPSRAVSQDEADIWRRATSGTAPLRMQSQAPYLARPAPSPADVRRRLSGSAQRMATPAYDGYRPGHAFEYTPGQKHAPEKPLDRAQLNRLKRGRLPIEGRIDLHGMTAVVAERNLRSFLSASQHMGRRAVLVITGRGLDTQGAGKGVLKRATPQWLAHMPDIVAGHAQADQRHGGAGALYVTLRRKDKVRRP